MHILSTGDTLNNGEFRIDKKIGSGGFGITYLATHIDLLEGKEEQVVIKEFFMSGCFREGTTVTTGSLNPVHFEKFKNSFLDEARLLYKFKNHKNIVNVQKFFNENGTAYFAMDYVQGSDMEVYAQSLPTNRITENEAIELLHQIGSALTAIHAQNYTHRDLKPQNILRHQNGKVYVLIDFGIARDFVVDESQVTSTIIKSEGYTPPEQYRQRVRRGDFTDVYGLAATLYRLLTGEKPTDALTRRDDLDDGILLPAPKKYNPSISPQLDAAIMKALELKPNDRFQTIKEFVKAATTIDDEQTAIFDTPIYQDQNEQTAIFDTPIYQDQNEQTAIFDTPIYQDQTKIEQVEEIKQKPISTPKPLPKQETPPKKEVKETISNKKSNRIPIFVGIGVLLFFIIGFGIYALLPKEDDAWQKAKTENTREAYQNFLSEYPTGTHQTEAKGYLNALEIATWQIAKNDSTEIGYQNYLAAYPTGNFAKTADSLIDVLYWNKAIAQNTKESYQAYKSDRPQGIFISKADSSLREIELLGNVEYQEQLKKEQEDFDQAKDTNTKDSYQSYLTTYPEGKFITQAKEGITQLEKEEEVQKKNAKSILDQIEKNMVYVQGGSFMMGSNEGRDNEKPVHKVTVSNFKVSKYEVTQAQWKAVMGNNPSKFKGCDNCPVEQVSWNDIQVFLKKLNELTGKNYRLPTEAEWEYAARGGNKSKGYKYAGSNSLGNIAWYDANSGRKIHQVGQKQPNELSLYDMSGNIMEWCQDWYDANYYAKSNNLTNPVNTTNTYTKVMRGGAWDISSANCLVVYRNGYDTSNRSRLSGFRICS